MEKKTNQSKLYDIDFYKSLEGDDAIKERMEHGRLPIMDIYGHPFFVDIRLGLLRPMDNFSTAGLDLNNGGYFDEEENIHLFYYHVSSMTEANIDPNITELPKDVVMIKFPNMYSLDPIATARLNAIESKAYLDEVPLKMYTKAEVIPLDQTYLVEVIKKNLEKKRGKQASIKPKRRQRKL